MSNKIKVLFYDIETSPILSYVWGLWKNDVGLNQIKQDWHVLSWAAKWLGKDKVMYADQRKAKNVEDDKSLLQGIWSLLDEADVVVTQNGKQFDEKKLNARFIINGFRPPSGYKHIDLLDIARRKFGFTSKSLAYMTSKLCKKHKKSEHKEFPGFELWKQCLAGNGRAWKEMESYNKLDVMSLEELYHKMIPWDSRTNFNLYHDSTEHICKCGSKDFHRNGFAYTPVGKYQRYSCKKCGAEVRGRDNLLSKEKKASLKVGIK